MLLICNGMTRAGSTLQYNLARNLVIANANGVGEGFFENNSVPAAIESWIVDRRIHVIKMHDVWEHAPSSGMRRCYIYRDIRDVAASAFRKFPISFDELITILRQAVETDYRIRDIPDVLVQRYERIFIDPATATAELAKYLDIETNTMTCEKIAARCLEESRHSLQQFDQNAKRRHHRDHQRTVWLKRFADRIPASLKNFLKKRGVRPLHENLTKTKSQSHTTTLLHPDHFSATQGQAGAWRSLFSAFQIDQLHNEFHGWLTENQYPLALHSRIQQEETTKC